MWTVSVISIMQIYVTINSNNFVIVKISQIIILHYING